MNNDDKFLRYRLEQGYSLKTIKTQNSYLKRFGSWLVNKQLSIENLNSENLLDCLSMFRENRSIDNVQNALQTIRIYLNYQVSKKRISINPALQIKLRSVAAKAKPQPLSSKTLEDIYKWFTTIETKTETEQTIHKRDIVVLGLLLFQGLDSGDLERLNARDIDLHQGTVYIASSRTNAARKLKLESIQILPVHEYLLTVRTQFKHSTARSDRLFTQSKIQDIVSRLVQQLKKQYPDIENPRHIRSSVIMNRLKTTHIRQVQYMCGHKRVSSTERYQKEDLQDLAQQLNKYHPMK